MWRSVALFAATEAGSRLKSRIESLAYYGAAAVIGFMGLAFALCALFIWMAQFMSPLMASLLIAAVLALIALTLVAVARRRPERQSIGRPLTATAVALAPTAMRIASKRVSLSTLAAVAVVGLSAVIGRRIARD